MLQKLMQLIIGATLFASMVAFANSDYTLAPGDKVAITVYGEEELSLETILGDSGKINYPFLGEVTLSGLTVAQVEQRITQGLKGDYLISPNVSARIVEYRPFYIHGEVKKPGSYPYQPGMTVNQAIALAGGLTERASTEKIWLYKERDNANYSIATLATTVRAGDTVTIKQRFF